MKWIWRCLPSRPCSRTHSPNSGNPWDLLGAQTLSCGGNRVSGVMLFPLLLWSLRERIHPMGHSWEATFSWPFFFWEDGMWRAPLGCFKAQSIWGCIRWPCCPVQKYNTVHLYKHDSTNNPCILHSYDSTQECKPFIMANIYIYIYGPNNKDVCLLLLLMSVSCAFFLWEPWKVLALI